MSYQSKKETAWRPPASARTRLEALWQLVNVQILDLLQRERRP